MLTHRVLGCTCYLIERPLTDCKIGLFFFLTFICIITPISGSRDNYCITGNFQKLSGRNKNRLRTTYSKNHEHFVNK